MTDSTQLVRREQHGRVACITLNRPGAGNAFHQPLRQALTEALESAEQDPETWVVLLRAAGPDFCLGLDQAAADAESLRPPRRSRRPFMGEYYEHAEKLRNWWQWLWDYTKPIVSQIQGRALGWGADLVLVSHTSVAGASARIGDPSVRMGLATQNPLWSWRIGPRRARQYLMLGDLIDAPTARRIGLVTRVVDDAGLAADALRAAETIAFQGGIVGWDGNWLRRRGFGQASHEARGTTAGWISAGAYSALAAIQRRGLQPGEFDFERRCEEAGPAVALREMIDYYGEP